MIQTQIAALRRIRDLLVVLRLHVVACSFARWTASIATCAFLLCGSAEAQCDQDFPTATSLQAARTALETGSVDVSLSPGGCLRYQRSFSPLFFNVSVLSREGVSFDGKPMIAWDHTYIPVAAPGPARSRSSGSRDSDLDGFAESRITIDRQIFSTTISGLVINPARIQSHIEISEFDPSSQSLIGRRLYDVPGDGTMQVTIQDGSSQTIRQYSASAVMEASEATTERRASLQPTLTPPGLDLVNPTPCPGGLYNDVMNALLSAAANGGQCLRGVFLYAEAASLAHLVATRPLRLYCENMNPKRRAGSYFDGDVDPQQSVILIIDLADWTAADAKGRESIVFHELLHSVFPDHDKKLQEALGQTGDPIWRENDRISACNSLCYNPNATKCSCAACRGASTCGVCSAYQPCFKPQNGGFCRCSTPASPSGRWFDSATQCVTDCPQGLACSGVQCEVERNACK